MVTVRKIIRRHQRVAKDLLSALQIIRPGVCQSLEQAQRHKQFTNTSNILYVVATVLGVAQVLRVAQVKYGNTVAIGVLPK